MSSLQGAWRLHSAAQVSADVDLKQDSEPQLQAWLQGEGGPQPEAFQPLSGLLLTLEADGTYREVAEQPVPISWYDEEGVLEAEARPFSGTWQESGGKLWLLTADSTSPTLRYDDGDTQVADALSLVGGHLLRSMSTVTDGLYLDRILLRYAR